MSNRIVRTVAVTATAIGVSVSLALPASADCATGLSSDAASKQSFRSAPACTDWNPGSHIKYGTAKLSVKDPHTGDDFGVIKLKGTVKGLSPDNYDAVVAILTTDDGTTGGHITGCSGNPKQFTVVRNGKRVKVVSSSPVYHGTVLVQALIVPSGLPLTYAVLATQPVEATIG